MNTWQFLSWPAVLIGLSLIAGLLAVTGVFSLPASWTATHDATTPPQTVTSTHTSPPDAHLASSTRRAATPDTGSDQPIVDTEQCARCHAVQDNYVKSSDHYLNERIGQTRSQWADAINLPVRCGSCHVLPKPSHLPTEGWKDAISFMGELMHYFGRAPGFSPAPTRFYRLRHWARATRPTWHELLHYHYVFSDSADPLPPDPPLRENHFQGREVGYPAAQAGRPMIGNVNIVDLDQNGEPDVLVSDFERKSVNWLRKEDGKWVETQLASSNIPGRTEVVDLNQDGARDIVVGVVGSVYATDKPVGSIQILTNNGPQQYSSRTLKDGIGRVADVDSGDLNGDGRPDILTGIFGYWKRGEIGWFEQKPNGSFAYHKVSDKVGTVQIFPVHWNDDDQLDILALIAQEHEEIALFINDGQGTSFTEHILFKSDKPSFGATEMSLADFDGDGDRDIALANGDAYQLLLLPYQGIRWLENKGNRTFEPHLITRLAGAYAAVTGDLDQDGDQDIASISLVNRWQDTTRKSIIWMENDGNGNFTPHGISNAPTAITTASIADLTGDGYPDIITGDMHRFESEHERIGRLTLWKNTLPGTP